MSDLRQLCYNNSKVNPQYAIAYALLSIATAIEDAGITVGDGMERIAKVLDRIATAVEEDK